MTLGLFRQAEQYSNMKAARELEKIRKQGEAAQTFDREAERQRQAEAAARFKQQGAHDDRLQWCVERIKHLEAEVARLREKLDETD
jgi:hypothetical protein